MLNIWMHQVEQCEEQNEKLSRRLKAMEAGEVVKLSNNMALDTPEEVRKFIAYNEGRIKQLMELIRTA